MFWRIPRKQYEADKGDRNKSAFRKLIKNGRQPGIIGYLRNEPVGWCAVAPREQYIGLERSRILKPVDQQAVWSVSCLFVRKTYRRQGLASKLLSGAVEFAGSKGARIVEGYPVDTSSDMADAFLWHGTASAFLAAGFKEVLRRSESRPIMRYMIGR
jgi:GNAT superfamily N-acetyltransferase